MEATATVDPIGIVQKTITTINRKKLIAAVVDFIQNRRHGQQKKGVKMLLVCSEYKGKKFFLAAHNQYISKENTRKIHTFYNRRDDVEGDELQLGYHGIGGQLLYLMVQGNCYFSTPEGYVDLGDISHVCNKILAYDTKDLTLGYRYFFPRNKSKRFIWEEEDFLQTPLGQFIKSQDFQTFILCDDPNTVTNKELSEEVAWDEFTSTLSRMYSTNIENPEEQLEIYTGFNLTAPTKLSPAPHLYLSPHYWANTYEVEWRLASKTHEKDASFWNSVGRWVHPSNRGKSFEEANKTLDFWFRLERNPSRQGTSYNTRFTHQKVPGEWAPHMRTIVARLKDECIAALPSNSKMDLGQKAYIFVQDDLLNDSPNNIDAATISNLPEGYNYRLIVQLLHKELKALKGCGLEIAEVKMSSQIEAKGSIAQAITSTLKLARKWFEHLRDTNRLSDTLEIIDADAPILNKMHNCNYVPPEKPVDHGRLGVDFERLIFDECKTSLTDFVWENGDAEISSRYGLDGQAIDGLCRIKKPTITWTFLIQVKAKSEYSNDDVEKFDRTCISYKVKHMEERVVKLLIMKGAATHKAETINYWTTTGLRCLAYPEASNTPEKVKEIVKDIHQLILTTTGFQVSM